VGLKRTVTPTRKKRVSERKPVEPVEGVSMTIHLRPRGTGRKSPSKARGGGLLGTRKDPKRHFSPFMVGGATPTTTEEVSEHL